MSAEKGDWDQVLFRTHKSCVATAWGFVWQRGSLLLASAVPAGLKEAVERDRSRSAGGLRLSLKLGDGGASNRCRVERTLSKGCDRIR